jgi:phosphatidylserine/phosphatidylglycerophosphate/cardiolipin synthase-like enzyme
MPRRASAVAVAVVSLLTAAPACAPPGGPAGGVAAGAGGPVQVLVEPDAGPGAVLALLAGARSALWMEMYLLTDADAIAALVARRQAGCDVRVILEPHPYQADGANDAAHDQLAAAGVDVRWANPRFALTHAKVATVDHARLVVMTLNLTRAGLRGNREYVAVDDDPADVAAADRVIAADLAGEADPDPGGAFGGSRLVTSPGTRAPLQAALDGAARTVAVETEELSDPDLAGALAGARSRGLAVGVGLPASGRSAATDHTAGDLAAASVQVGAVAYPPLHAKAVVVDGAWLYVGSANLTSASLDANREVGLRIDDPTAIATVGATIAADLAAAAKQ